MTPDLFPKAAASLLLCCVLSSCSPDQHSSKPVATQQTQKDYYAGWHNGQPCVFEVEKGFRHKPDKWKQLMNDAVNSASANGYDPLEVQQWLSGATHVPPSKKKLNGLFYEYKR